MPPQINDPEHPVIKFIRGKRQLQILLDDAFKNSDEYQMGLEKLVSSLGWTHFKNRWSSLYVFKMIFDNYPNEVDLELVVDVIKFEERFQSISALTHSRVFLLGFYLKMVNLYFKKNNPEITDDEWAIPTTVDEILTSHVVKTEQPDWLILCLWHFCHFLGAEKVKPLLAGDNAYAMLFAYLTEPQRYQLVNNLLAYGCAIQEPEFFTFEKV
jgi:hypothetical protein